mmetsp:Transcript_10937/g.11072  ORF Transcript_10937/g.11072 Transcript_10937/m.11072 type:complete len:152 (-) Transcript_10937:52-507(-)
MLQELRRGAGKALITSITFHPTHNLIACTSDRSSIHLFEIKKSVEKSIDQKQFGVSNGDSFQGNQGNLSENKKSKFSFMKVLSKYFDSEWCVTKIKIDEKFKTVGFDVKNHKLIIMTFDRVLYYVDIPQAQVRYLEEAEMRIFQSDYTDQL